MCPCFHNSSLLPAHASPNSNIGDIVNQGHIGQTGRLHVYWRECAHVRAVGRQRNRGPSSDLAGPRQAKGGGTGWPSRPRCRILPRATISHKIKLLALRISSLAGPHLQRQPLGTDNTSHANTPVVATAQQPEPCPHFLGLLLGLRRRRGSVAAWQRWAVMRVHQGWVVLGALSSHLTAQMHSKWDSAGLAARLGCRCSRRVPEQSGASQMARRTKLCAMALGRCPDGQETEPHSMTSRAATQLDSPDLPVLDKRGIEPACTMDANSRPWSVQLGRI